MVSPPPSVGVWNLVSGAIVGVAGGLDAGPCVNNYYIYTKIMCHMYVHH
jgi:hypothetical protein